LRRRGAVCPRDRRALSRPRAVGHRLAASQHAEGSAGRGRAGRHDPEDRADRGIAAQASGRQSDEAVLELTAGEPMSDHYVHRLQTSMPLATAEKIVDAALKAGAEAKLLPLTIA